MERTQTARREACFSDYRNTLQERMKQPIVPGTPGRVRKLEIFLAAYLFASAMLTYTQYQFMKQSHWLYQQNCVEERTGVLGKAIDVFQFAFAADDSLACTLYEKLQK